MSSTSIKIKSLLILVCVSILLSTLEVHGAATNAPYDSTTNTTTTKKPYKSGAVSTMKFTTFLMILPVLPLAHLVYF